MKILVIGDSMVKYLNEYLTSDLSDHEVDTFSFPGARIERIKDKLRGLKQYDWMVIHVGTNNVEGDDISDIVWKYTSLFQEVSRLHPGVKVIASGIIPRGPNFFLDYQSRYALASHVEALNAKTEIVNAELEKACLSREAFYFCWSLGSWEGLLGRDGLHLSSRGNSFLAKMFGKTLEGLIAMEAGILKKCFLDTIVHKIVFMNFENVLEIF